ncbi:MAG: glycosyltransferase family 4 protein [Solirubrobacteraceae bacterium]
MKVGLVSTLDSGGPVEHTITLAGGLAAAGVEVRVVCATRAVADRAEAEGASVVLAPLRHQLDVGGARRVRRALAGVDVVHGQDRRAGLWIRVLPPAGARRVYTVHGLPEPYLPPPAGPARPGLRARLAYRGIDALLARRADAIITVSRAVKDELVTRLGWPAERITVIANGVALDALLEQRGELVGTLASFTPVKGLEVFLDAVALLAPARPQTRFALFGDGPLAAALQAQAHGLGLNGAVSFPGRVPARGALARLAVLVVPSYMENAPLALLEAMTAGVPAVVTRVGGIPELAPPGTALLVAPGDPAQLAEAIGRLLDDSRLAEMQIAAARSRVEATGGAPAMVARTLALYETLLA